MTTTAPSQHNVRASRWLGLALAAGFALLLLPFVNKPFHVDDTVFLRIAEWILDRPLAPYDFTYSWSSQHLPMWRQTLHPPLFSYFLAAVGGAAGFSEVAVHLSCFALAAGCVLLMHRLATRFCASPTTATLATVVSPAFLVSATTAMSDVPLLFCWLLAVDQTVRAADTARPSRLWLAGLAASAAAMTKYFGIALVPLLIVYWQAGQRRAGFNRSGRLNVNLFALLMPAVVLSAWGFYSFVHSGQFHPGSAAHMAATYKRPEVLIGNLWHIVPYFGASLLWPCWLLVKSRQLPGLWRWLLLNTAIAAAAMYWLALSTTATPMSVRLLNMTLYSSLSATGMLVVVLCLSSCARRRDTDTLLLGLWMFGTLFFASVINWTCNVRVLLPAIFPATLLVLRWIELEPEPENWLQWARFSIVPTAAVALLVGLADYQYAAAVRDFVATRVAGQIERGTKAYFTGHWGFQWYMEEAGASALDGSAVPIQAGDILVHKSGNDNFFPELPRKLIWEESVFSPLCLQTFRYAIHGNFYDGTGGGLPYAFNPNCSLEQFRIYRIMSEDLQPKGRSSVRGRTLD
jgi:4-amino-4-deoxy-L-arabinose transferase-like glycosyltransferase